MVGQPEQMNTAPLQVRTKRGGTAGTDPGGGGEVLVGRAGVAHVELDRLADLDELADGDGSGALVGAEHARKRKSPRSKSARCSSTTMPTCRPRARSSRSCSSAAATNSSRRDALRPPSSYTMLRSGVTVNGLPTRRQPCDTIVRTGISEGITTPTAPLGTIRSSSARRFAPGAAPAEASPPMTRSPGTFVLHRDSRSATGNENGSASRSTVASAAVAVPTLDPHTPSAAGSTSSTKPSTRPPPQSAAQR